MKYINIKNRKFPIIDSPEYPYLNYNGYYSNLEPTNENDFSLKFNNKYFNIKSLDNDLGDEVYLNIYAPSGGGTKTFNIHIPKGVKRLKFQSKYQNSESSPVETKYIKVTPDTDYTFKVKRNTYDDVYTILDKSSNTDVKIGSCSCYNRYVGSGWCRYSYGREINNVKEYDFDLSI